MLLGAALNGDRSRDQHPCVPLTAAELATDASACVAAGAGAIHLHPRDQDGRETLDPEVVDRIVLAVRAACGVRIGVSTGAWIEPDAERRAWLIAGWRGPNFASVNMSEEGAVNAMRACRSAGVGIEAGVWSEQDADALAASGLAHRVARVLVELIDLEPSEAATRARAIHVALDRHRIAAPRLQHGEGPATWPMLHDAIARGIDTRIGLEDTLLLPDGRRAADNAELVAVALGLAGTTRSR